MENATKALLMAGEIVLALLIISVIVYMYSIVSNFQKEQEMEREVAQIVEFNEQYETYNKKIMYGADVISVINKAVDNNIRYPSAENQITITVEIANELTLMHGQVGQITVQGSHVSDEDYEEIITKTKIYSCTGITYSASTGKVSSMSFEYYHN